MRIFDFNPVNELRNRVSRPVWVVLLCIGLLGLLLYKYLN